MIEAVAPSSSLFDGMVSRSFCTGGICIYQPIPDLILPVGNYRFKLSSHTIAGDSAESSWQSFTVAIGTFLPFIGR